ncbi:helix-hairpin-helix domain-containing protein [Bacillus carboniphilus]
MLESPKRIFIIALLLFLIFFIGFWMQKKEESAWNTTQALTIVPESLQDEDEHPNEELVPPENMESLPEKEIWVYVDVKGAVDKPGVYKVSENSRVQDVVKKAGGFTKEADQMQINLALKVWDQMLLYVPEQGEEIEIVSTPVISSQDSTDHRINVNTATLQELMTLNGIGEKKAEAIIKYREENGPFISVEELLNISGIGEGILSKIREDISL